MVYKMTLSPLFASSGCCAMGEARFLDLSFLYAVPFFPFPLLTSPPYNTHPSMCFAQFLHIAPSTPSQMRYVYRISSPCCFDVDFFKETNPTSLLFFFKLHSDLRFFSESRFPSTLGTDTLGLLLSPRLGKLPSPPLVHSHLPMTGRKFEVLLFLSPPPLKAQHKRTFLEFPLPQAPVPMGDPPLNNLSSSVLAE